MKKTVKVGDLVLHKKNASNITWLQIICTKLPSSMDNIALLITDAPSWHSKLSDASIEGYSLSKEHKNKKYCIISNNNILFLIRNGKVSTSTNLALISRARNE